MLLILGTPVLYTIEQLSSQMDYTSHYMDQNQSNVNKSI